MLSKLSDNQRPTPLTTTGAPAWSTPDPSQWGTRSTEAGEPLPPGTETIGSHVSCRLRHPAAENSAKAGLDWLADTSSACCRHRFTKQTVRSGPCGISRPPARRQRRAWSLGPRLRVHLSPLPRFVLCRWGLKPDSAGESAVANLPANLPMELSAGANGRPQLNRLLASTDRATPASSEISHLPAGTLRGRIFHGRIHRACDVNC